MKRFYLNKLFQNHLRPPIYFNPRYESKQATSNKDAIEYCANIVRQHDYENFLATLLMTKAVRYPAMVLRAFNVEVARIQDQTTDAQTAAFRLQFWKDTVRDFYKSDQTLNMVPHNPIAQELFKLCCCYSIPRRNLEKLITSRSGLLKTRFFHTLEDVEKYAEEAVSTLYYSILAVARVTNVHVDHAASHLGKAQGITNILRSIHVSNHLRTITLPMDILMNNKVSQENVLRGVVDENMRNVAFEIASRANSHLEKARKIQVPKEVNQIFLPATAVHNYLVKLQKCNFNVFDKSLQRGSATLPFTLYYNRFRNRF